SVAAMMLYEEGALELTDPVSAFIPSFAHVRVHTGGPDLRPVTVPATEPVRVWHLLTHTAGLTYGFHRVHPVDAMYRAAGFGWATVTRGGWRPCTRRARTGRRSGWTPWAMRHGSGRRCSAEAPAWCRRRPTITGSPKCCCTARTARRGSWMAPGCWAPARSA